MREVFAGAAIFGVEAVLQFALVKTLLLDEREQLSSATDAADDRRVTVEQARESKTVEPVLVRLIQQSGVLEQISLFDCEADELSARPARPIKDKFFHVGDDCPDRSYRFITEHPFSDGR